MSVEVIMYSTRFCPYCMRARRLLKNKGVDYEEISVSGDRAMWAEMEQLAKDNPAGSYPSEIWGEKEEFVLKNINMFDKRCIPFI